MLPTSLVYSLCFLLGFSPTSQVVAQSLTPFVYPLAVRSPYLNACMRSYGAEDGDGNPAKTWPTFWPTYGTNKMLGWSCFVQIVDGDVNQTYSFMGNQPPLIVNASESTLVSSQVTPTQTNFDWRAGPISLTVNYLSPIEPDDWVKQSFPFSYIAVSVQPNDGQAHTVRLYCDISGEWTSYKQSQAVQWETVQTPKSLFHSVQRNNPQFLSEDHSVGEDGAVYHATLLKDKMTWRTGSDAKSRTQFFQSGSLDNTQDSDFRNIEDAWPVMAIAFDLGSISQVTEPIVWAIGKARDPAILYKGASGQQERHCYFWSKYSNLSSAIDDFLMDYSAAKKRADALDEKIQGDAANISNDYKDLVSLATRQTFAATELTIVQGSDGSWNYSDVKMFMREMGNGTRVSPVDVMYASWPAFIYLNSSLAGRLLDPLLEYQSTSEYRNEYAAANLGIAYPNATGNPSIHSQSVEQSSNMLIMALSHARASGDGSLISTYYDLLKKWADHLVGRSLSLAGQESADGVSLGNMSNLALKGIIGVKAFSEISAALHQVDDEKNYTKTGRCCLYGAAVASTALTNDHIESLIGDPSSNGMIYNLYADALLRTNIVPQQIIDLQSNFYLSKASNDSPKYGLAVDFEYELANTAKSHWTMFAAAITSTSASRDALISMVHSRPGAVSGVFPSTYNTGTGAFIEGENSPAQGAMYALLALNVVNKTIVATPPHVNGERGGSSKSPSVGTIAGSVIGGVAGLFIALLIVLVWRRRHISKGVANASSGHGQAAVNGTPTRQAYSDSEREMVAADHSLYPLHGENHFRDNLYAAQVNAAHYSDPGHPQLPLHGRAPPNPHVDPTASVRRRLLDPKLKSMDTVPQVSVYSPDPSSEGSSLRSDALSSDAANQLRSEVNSLRQQMEEMRAGRGYDVPPPSYPNQ